MSWDGDDEIAPGSALASEPSSSPGWMIVGYLVGVFSMSAAPVLFFWFSAMVSWFCAPLVPLLIAFACVLAGTVDRRFHTAAARAATGAAAAAVFGTATMIGLFFGLASFS